MGCRFWRPDPRATDMQALRAYESVLASQGIDAETDTSYYRILLTLSLDESRSDWRQKLAHFAAQHQIDVTPRTKAAARRGLSARSSPNISSVELSVQQQTVAAATVAQVATKV